MTDRMLDQPNGIAPVLSERRPRTTASKNSSHGPQHAASGAETLQLETFQPDLQDGGPIDEEGYISEEDDDVFAFERPITAAPRTVVATNGLESPHLEDAVVMTFTPGPPLNHSRNPSNLSNKPSFISASSYLATTEEGFTTDTTSLGRSNPSLAKKTITQARRMRQMLQKEILEVIPGSREGSRGLSVRAGDTTVPDGRTTRGDGLGNMVRQWNSVQGTERVGFDDEGEVEDSPYEEVRASVSNIDDPEMPSKCGLASHVVMS